MGLSRGGVVVVSLCAALAGCRKGADEAAKDEAGVEDLTIVVEADKSRIMQEEEKLQATRAEVDQERERIEKERGELEKKLATLSKKDKKQRDKLEADEQRLEAEDKKLRDRMKSFETERASLESDKNKLLERISQMTQSKGGLSMAQREEILVRREKEITKREAKAVEHEKEIGKLQADAVRSLQEINKILADLQAGGGVRTVMVPGPAGGGSGSSASGPKATKTGVQKLQKDLKTKMDTKGILVADLPPAARDLDKGAKTAMSGNDLDAAQQALTDLGAVVDGIKVDHAFVQAKFGRINKSYPKEKIEQLDEKKRKQVLSLLDEVSDSFSDGRYDRANKKINQLYRLLEGGE
ncbi:MAG: hypothetical protein HY903_11800 [Deltaproteobacteria bacterium]|nr:hypothetical protein [Deltaproteobacteria bacterium]